MTHTPGIEAKHLETLKESLRGTVGIYPAAYCGVPRTEWQDGWNAFLMQWHSDKQKSAGAEWDAGYEACRLEEDRRLSSAVEWWSAIPSAMVERLWQALEDEQISLYANPGKTPACALSINCNDVWAWACSDSEPVPLEDLPEVLNAIEAGPWQTVIWASKRRGWRPQKPIERDMKKDGAWDVALEGLEIVDGEDR